MYRWATELFPINRSLTGPGVRDTLDYLADLLPGLIVHAVPTGTQVFDWTVPNEWAAREAWIKGPDGRKIIDFVDNTLHLVGYSTPVQAVLPLSELQRHLYSLPDQPDAVPYVTSYYKERWGFCLTDQARAALPDGNYEVFIDTTLAPGVLNYGELLIPGDSADEVFVSTYICHPSMANNELSGPVVAAALAQSVLNQGPSKYSFRFVFIPETIGSITYLSRNLDHLKRHIYAGFNLTCIGDDRAFSFLPSRKGDTLADRAALAALREVSGNDVQHFDWLTRGSDERQYCAPGVDLPVASIMRSKYGTYPEYHTSLDDLTLVTPTGLFGGFRAARTAIDMVEGNYHPRATVLGEPQLGKRGLYNTLSIKGSAVDSRILLNILSLADGDTDLIALADRLTRPFAEIRALCEILVGHDLLTRG
ncbi:MAG: DUF4910 domain-containing protein [Rubellimicrobium sp.]|nr:DUF4910 domain-containing protein [Rubellimicrobium sp.]